MCRTTPFQNPATARTAGSCERTGATKAPVLSPAILPIGGFTFGFGVKACSGGSPRLPPHGLDKSHKRVFVGTAAPPPLTRRKGSQGQQGAVFSTLRETAVLFVNGVVILPLEERAFLLSIFRPSGRPKWVRAPARKKRLAALVASQTLCLPHLRVGKLPSPTCCQQRPGDATLRCGDTSCCACFFPSPVVH